MKIHFLFVGFALILMLAPVPAFAQQASLNDVAWDVSTPLSNKDILGMVEKHLSESEILVAINSSPCVFDTFPPVLEDLKRRGVPEPVLKAMLKAPYGPSAKAQREELDEQAIYHFADQLRLRNILSSAPGVRGSASASRAVRTRAPRTARRRA
ncbi:MAG: hypothetical protein ACR2H6_01975 [Pyrinomonadaceae bacterium]